eukprot:CAMPEP_0174250520 /NCGR_PEP_ID=MMETSP0439-20130205/666_1 /TAXON_ID=0 /ORGANISM="Stereomyxa ramosa, Strain Chinc5" /LENGTH=66 /DNA_ID=CAMNT_0015330613 /DNA_START=773 /DNA_END=973 /DNA_ORIENTATION=+
MSWDRFVYFLATSIVLYIGLPYEEEKLIVEFGDAYKKYIDEVPSLNPLWPQKWLSDRRKAKNKKRS